MRILFVAEAPSIHTRRLAEYFRDRGCEVHVASLRPYRIDGVTVHLMRGFGLGKLGYLFALIWLPKVYRAIQPDIVHAHHLTSYGYLAARSGVRPLIVTAWGSDVLLAPKKSKIGRYLAQYAVRHADVVTTVAAHMNSSVAQLGVAAEKIAVIPFGVDTDMFAPAAYSNPPSNSIKLICTRNHAPLYDVETLIRAVAKIKDVLGLTVDLVGDGPMRPSLQDLAVKLAVADRVKFHGHVAQRALAALLAQSEIFVSPALSDGNNVSLNEGMACGCFPIATDIPANRQWIVHGVNGYLYAPGIVESLATAIEDASRASDLRRRARIENRLIVQERANWRVNAEQIYIIYLELTKGKNEPN